MTARGNGSRRLPVVLQAEAAECGLACLAMVAQSHGLTVDLPTLRRRFNPSIRGSTLSELVSIAGAIGLSARAVRCEISALKRLRLPVILHWSFTHFVVLRRITSTAAVLHDPLHGRRTVDSAEFGRHFTGVALELSPIAGFVQSQPQPRLRMSAFFSGLGGVGWTVAQIIIVALALEVLALIVPALTRWIIDGVLLSGDRELLLAIALGYALLVIITTGLTTLRSWMILYLSTELSAHWFTSVFSHLLRLPVAFFEKRFMGDVMSRFQSVRSIQQILSTTFFETALDGAMGAAVLVVMLTYSSRLSAIAVTAIVLYTIVRQFLYAPLRATNSESLTKWAMQNGFVLETIRGIQTLRLYAMEHHRRARWAGLLTDAINKDVTLGKLTIGFRSANVAIFGIERVATLCFGALFVLNHAFSVGMLVAFLAYKELFIMRSASLIDDLYDLRLLEVHRERVADIVLSDPEPDLPFQSQRISRSATIKIEDVSFRYSDTGPYVLKNVTCTIVPGAMTVIMGPSASGKTTLVKIILGLLTPSGGRVLVDGLSAAGEQAALIRAGSGSVMQDDVLFAGSIGDNIALFDPFWTYESVTSAAQAALIHDEIMEMPMRYDSLVGDMGTTMSGGQRQRIILARALYRNPELLILDEATSHLDVANERQIGETLKALEMTRIVVAHRPETIAAADYVIELRGGQVVA
jgi:ATP-binding cassette subfamily B protein RaxB